MILLDTAIPAFDSYLAESANYWTKVDERRPRDNGIIVVDLMHNNASALMGTLLVGRFVAHQHNARLAAIISDHFLDWPTPVEQVKRLGAAFGVEQFFRVQPQSKLPKPKSLLEQFRSWLGSERGSVIETIQRLSGQALRQAVLDMKIMNIPVGDLVYDTYLRKNAKASITYPDEKLIEEIVGAFSRMDQYAAIMGRRDVIGCVTSDKSYIDFGGLLRTAVALGKIGVTKVMSGPSSVREYKTVDECYDYPWPRETDLEFVRARLGPELARRAEKFFPPHLQRAEEIPYFQISYGSQMLRPVQEELRSRLGISKDKPSIGIIVPMFEDAPHSIPDLLHQDYGCWLENTLKVCAEVTHVQWLIRNHPYAVAVGLTKEFDRIVTPYVTRYNHMKICPTDIATEVLFPILRTIVTAASTTALEFASIGSRPVICGRTFYADLGFVERPADVDAYAKILRNIEKIQPLTADQILTAKEIAYVYFRLSIQPTNLLPPAVDIAGVTVTIDMISQFWDVARNSLRRYRLEDDSMWRNFKRMEEEGRTLLLRFEEIELNERKAESPHPVT